MTKEQWQIEAIRRYGPLQPDWKFRCPSCLSVVTVRDYVNAGKSSGIDLERVNRMVAFSCVGRLLPDPAEAFHPGSGPCNYAGGGLIGLNPVDVDGTRYFDFADDPLTSQPNLKEAKP